MFTSIVFTTILASSAVLLSQAQVDPNEPGPGESFPQGGTCHIAWNGDTTSGSTTGWKDMAIELMTGSNEKMVHLTTVATGKDGTIAGVFDYTCPEVIPNSPIYFYQFTAAGTSNFTWTTRFTIAGADNSSTPATETEQSNGQTVAFGTGALADPSSSSSQSNSASDSPSSIASAATKPASSLTRSSTATKSSDPSSASSAPQTSGSSAAVAVGPMVLDTRMWPFVAALTASAMAFTILL
ncbi:hypothetical protein B0H13DRAFT_2044669 [Mycena leptocephala]|nr:hypothetical protein B0H13DRAFT_2044669 [Mycena leptocephala]